MNNIIIRSITGTSIVASNEPMKPENARLLREALPEMLTSQPT